MITKQLRIKFKSLGGHKGMLENIPFLLLKISVLIQLDANYQVFTPNNGVHFKDSKTILNYTKVYAFALHLLYTNRKNALHYE